ncbi:MAG: PAS domain S-box protein [Myxococcota bacterium]
MGLGLGGVACGLVGEDPTRAQAGLLLLGMLVAFLVGRLGRAKQAQVDRLTADLSTEILERKRAEEARRQSEMRMRAFFENSVAALGISKAGVHVSVNAAYARMFGHESPEVLVGTPILDLIAPSHRQEILELVRRRSRREDVPDNYETRALRKDGTEFDMDVCVSSYEEDGEVFTIVVLRDITPRKVAERQLEESEARYRSLYNRTPVMLHSIDHEGRLLAVSDQWLATLGYERAEVLGRRSTEFLTEQSRRHAQEVVLPRYWKTGWCKDVPYQFVKRNGEKVDVLLSAIAEMGPQGPTRSLAVIIDVTERNRLEEALRQAQKMEAIGLLAGGIAHDFNNILTSIAGHAELIHSGLPPESPLLGDVEQVAHSVERAAALTHQLLAFSRRQVLKPQVLDLGAVVVDIEKMLRRLIGEHIELVTELAPGVGPVRVDPGQMQQVIMNLAINARDAMPNGGRLVLRTGARELACAEAAAMNLPPGSYVTLEVEDNGSGMDEVTRVRVFEPFFTTKALGRGTGLGLSTVYGIVTQSGGHIRVESQPGVGSVFRVLLPRVSGPASVVPTTPVPTGAVEGNETILLVEDEEMLRRLLRPVLEMRGYTVLEAPHGAEAWEKCCAHPGPVHLVVTDVVMPQLGGRELVARLRARQPDIKVLYVSGYTDDDMVHRGVGAEGAAFLQKPFTPETLVRTVRQVLDDAGPRETVSRPASG